jgi:hypothetical protein
MRQLDNQETFSEDFHEASHEPDAKPSFFFAARLRLRVLTSCQSPSEKEPSTIKELQVPRMADDVEVSSAFPVTMVDFTTTQLLARGLVSA